MIQVYTLEGDRIAGAALKPGEPLPAKALWIDLLNPTAEEDKAVEGWIGSPVPTDKDMVEIEESSRFYMEGGVQYLTTPVLHATDSNHRTVSPVSFVLAGKHLVTVRYSEPKAFSLFINRATKAGNGLIEADCTGISVLLGLIEAITDRLADILEGATEEIEAASNAILHRREHERPMSTLEFRRTLTRIGGLGAFLSKVRESLSGISRLLAYMRANMEGGPPRKEMRNRLDSLERDARSLENYVDFLSNKVTFLLDTIVGLISVEQNAIIKIFSVAAVGLMPPTLIASIYGMNFQFMPELDERWGYPLTLGVMAISAVLPLYYFWRKGWF
ncbi:magnesium transporter CorA family protein [Chelativorans sp. AA-79]|uniref:magnesium transporter CorA family protein n=1 Tax=Chelativorans sp. AA-79 TaxID=3028735 RepID=UPI0023F9538D|nr:magnesium transporter CorA family protein [Chelativorans sp. AA-79]WEX07767.1 magnesium transporter CorA family protein [Chelativorans sp. AA-79]